MPPETGPDCAVVAALSASSPHGQSAEAVSPGFPLIHHSAVNINEIFCPKAAFS